MTLPGEFEFIRRLAAHIPSRGDVRVGIGDDTAVLPGPADLYTLLTTDMLVEGRHFLPGADLYNVGRKALAVNVSDVAAMGGRPTYAVVSLGVPDTLTMADAERLYIGFHDECLRHGMTIVGGDTVASPVLTINVALQGEVEQERLLLRKGARPGDNLVVTGHLGEGAAGLLLMQHPKLDVPFDVRQRLTLAQERPVPRVQAGRELGRGVATAAIDVSDGIAGDARLLCEASSVGAVIDEAALPLSEDVRLVAEAAGTDPVTLALTGGEDFELLFTTGREPSERWRHRFGTKCTVIGHIVPREEGLSLRRLNGSIEPLQMRGFLHF